VNIGISTSGTLSDKFRASESVRLPINLASNHRDDEESHEEGQQPEVQKMPEMYQ
jgi:hypothetical protein